MAKTIMVADDDHEFLAVIESVLKGKGYTVLTASNGEDVIDKARGHKPDLILMDVEMPRMDGDEAAMILKGDAATKHIPILFLTGLHTEQEIEELHEDDIISKPVHFDQLFAKVKSLLGE